MIKLRYKSHSDREALTQRIADRMDGPMTALGLIFLLLVLGETLVRPRGALSTVFTVTSWVLWGIFVAEFILRMTVAPSTSRFLKKYWWQVIFLSLIHI